MAQKVTNFIIILHQNICIINSEKVNSTSGIVSPPVHNLRCNYNATPHKHFNYHATLEVGLALFQCQIQGKAHSKIVLKLTKTYSRNKHEIQACGLE